MIERPAVSTDRELSWDSPNGRVTYDVPARCAACTRCLLHRGSLTCPWGGPYNSRLEAKPGCHTRL